MIKLNLQAEHLGRIRHIAKVEKGHMFQFLGYALDLETGEFSDLLEKSAVYGERTVQIMTGLLFHYSLAKETPKTGNLVKFKDLPGGYAYEGAFIQRAVNPIAEVFGDKPVEVAEAAKLLKGAPLDYGCSSVEIPAVEGIPIVYILWAAEEFPASANVLFDGSASCFLPTEDLAGLGELTTFRLLKAHSILKENKHS